MDEYSFAFSLPFPTEIQLPTKVLTPIEWNNYFLYLSNTFFNSTEPNSSHVKQVERCCEVIEHAVWKYHAVRITITQLPDIEQVGFVIIFPYSAYAKAYRFDLYMNYSFLSLNHKWHNRFFSEDIQFGPMIHVSVPIPHGYYTRIQYDENEGPSSLKKVIAEEIRQTRSKYKLKLLRFSYDLVDACIQNRVARFWVDETDYYSKTVNFHFHFFTKSDFQKMLDFMQKYNFPYELSFANKEVCVL